MNLDKDYQRIQGLKKEFEAKLNVMSSRHELLIKDETEAIQNIDAQFKEYIDALLARKQELVKAVGKSYLEQKEKIAQHQKSLRDCIEVCNIATNTAATTPSHSKAQANANIGLLETMMSAWREVSRIAACFEPVPDVRDWGEVNYYHSSAGDVSTLAGIGSSRLADGKGTAAGFYYPRGMCINPLDNCLYVCDSDNHIIRKVTREGEASQLTVKRDEEDHRPFSIAYHGNEKKLFVVYQNIHRVKKISLSGAIEDFVGSDRGNNEGLREVAKLSSPWGIAVNSKSGVIYVADYANNCIRKITTAGQMTTLAGDTKGSSGSTDGNGPAARFYYPRGLYYCEKYELLYVCDHYNRAIRAINVNSSEVNTITRLEFRPDEITMLTDDSLLVASDEKRQVYRVDIGSGGKLISVFVGSGLYNAENGIPSRCGFMNFGGLLFDETSNVCYISTVYGNVIQQVSVAR